MDAEGALPEPVATPPKGRSTRAHGFGHRAPPYEVGMFESGGVRLSYEVHGHGHRVLVFMHGILLDANLNRRLAQDLAELGNRVVLLDLPGHGLSDKPRRASFHRMDTYADHVVALLDHLGLETAVIGGVSLGGNVSLLMAAENPDRVQGLLIEMPVLEWALPAAAATFIPMLLAVHFARPAVRRLASAIRRLPRTGNGPVDSIMNAFSNDPVETAAVLHGILAGPVAADGRPACGNRRALSGHRPPGRPDPPLSRRRAARTAAATGRAGRGQLRPRVALPP